VEEKQSRKIERILLFTTDALVVNDAIDSTMETFLMNLRKKDHIGIVSVWDLTRLKEVLGKHVLHDFDYVFTENGLVVHHDGHRLETKPLSEHLGEDKLKSLINFCLRYIADLDIPVKRGNFFELHHGSINVSPIGRNCNQKEREAFAEYDQKNNIRGEFIAKLEEKFQSYNLNYTKPDVISFDIRPDEWDESYCLRHLSHKKVHFFGNSKVVKADKHIEVHVVNSAEETITKASELK